MLSLNRRAMGAGHLSFFRASSTVALVAIGVSRHESWSRRKDEERGEGEYRYYQCQSRTNQSFCQYHTRKAEDLDRLVMATLSNLDSPEALEQWLELHPLPKDRTAELPLLRGRLVALERKLRRNLNQAARGAIPLEKLRAMGGEMVRERRMLERSLAVLAAEARGELTEKARREHFLSRLREIREQWGALTVSGRKAVLQDVIDQVVVYDERVETLLRV